MIIDPVLNKAYVLLSWEEVAPYVKKKWFFKEAIRHKDSESFFIPIKYIFQVQKGYKLWVE